MPCPIPHPRVAAALATALAVLMAAGAPGAPLPSAPPVAAVSPADTALVDLAPTSDPPWNPPAPVPAAEPWETALRIPGRVVSMPLSAAGVAAGAGLAFVEESDLVPRVAAQFARFARLGILLRPASLGDHTGWGGEIGLSPPFLRALDVAASGSTGRYGRLRVALGARGTGVEWSDEWRPRDAFFGIGADARSQDLSAWAESRVTALATLSLDTFRPRLRPSHPEFLEDPVSGDAPVRRSRPEAAIWAGARSAALLDGRDRDRDRIPVSERFPTLSRDLLARRVQHRVVGARLGHDTRSGRPHWSRGWRARVAIERFEPWSAGDVAFLPGASADGAGFTRVTWEGETGVSFYRDPRTVRLAVKVVDQSLDRGAGLFLPSDLATLGASEGLSGFEPGRFRDADLALCRLTYVFPLARYLEADIHSEAGMVAPRMEAMRSDRMEFSHGFRLRVRNPHAPLAAIGFDASRETIRFQFSMGGVE